MFWAAKNSTVLSKFASLPRPVRKKAWPMVIRVMRGARKASAAATFRPKRAARDRGAGAFIAFLRGTVTAAHPTSVRTGMDRAVALAHSRAGAGRGLG